MDTLVTILAAILAILAVTLVGLAPFIIVGVLAALWPRFFPPRCPHRRPVGQRYPKCPYCAEEEAKRQALSEQWEAEQQAKRDAEQEVERREIARLREEETAKIRQLTYLQELDPLEFERLLLQAYRNLGWEAKATKASGDQGVDGWLTRDGKTFILQCKRFAGGRVGSPVLRDLLGTVVKEHAQGGILATTSFFSEEAVSWARDLDSHALELLDGYAVVKLLAEAFPDGSLVPEWFVSRRQHPAVVPSYCPQCGKKTRRRRGKHGAFIGCTGYPTCHWTMPVPGRRRRR